MARCLYGDGGFYSGDGTAGRRTGDFITSPEVGPLFGAVLAEAIDAWWEALGRPDPLTIYDVGCGPGALLRSVALARGGGTLERPWHLVGVDRAPSGDDVLPELPDDLTGAVVVANELLDNLPFRIVERTADQSTELWVLDGEPRLRPATLPLSGPTASMLDRLPVGAPAPLTDQASAWVSSVLERGASVLCAFDYGARTTAELVARGDWLRTYRGHRRGHDPFNEPGRWDITADVAWDQLPTPGELLSQAEFLTRHGIERLVGEGKAYWKANAARPDLTAMKMRSRISEAEALLDPDGLGGWLVGIWTN